MKTYAMTREQIQAYADSLRVARQLDSAASAGGALRLLRKGQAIAAGDRLRPDGSFGYARPVITNIASFEERERHGKE